MSNKKQIIKDLENVVKELQGKIDELKKEEKKPKFESVKKGEIYYSVNTSMDIDVCSHIEKTDRIDDSLFLSNNYFHTRERAEQVAEKIKFLLKLERIHDILCPDYVPDWNDYNEDKWYVYYQCYKGKYCISGVSVTQRKNNVYFPDKETAERACIMLSSGEI